MALRFLQCLHININVVYVLADNLMYQQKNMYEPFIV